MSTAWQEEALCAEVGPGPFFPHDGESPNRWPQAGQARLICADCPVREACLRAALEAERGDDVVLRAGMFGGLTPAERAALDGRALKDGPSDPNKGWKHGPDTVQRIREMYDAGMVVREIAATIGLTFGQTRNIIRRHKMASRIKRVSTETASTRDSIILNMRAGGLTRRQVAEQLGVTLAVVDNARRRNAA